MTQTDEALRRLLDTQEIQQVLMKYSIAIDSRHLNLFHQVFSPDAMIDLAGTGQFSVEQYIGLSGQVLEQLEVTQHFLSPAVIDVQGNTARSRCYFMAQHGRNSEAPAPFLMIGGTYDDELARLENGWRITRRVGTATWIDGNVAVLGYPLPPGGLPWSEARDCPPWLAAGS